MKMQVDKIPQEGLELYEDIDAKALALDTENISFTQPIHAKASIAKSGNQVFIDIKLNGEVEYICAKCLAKFPSSFKKGFKISIDARPSDTIELDEDIRQEVILDYPMKTLCKIDCKGLCPNCGQNLNAGECECEKETSDQRESRAKARENQSTPLDSARGRETRGLDL